ncbi:MAG: glycogen-binding domain-containing protein [Verrucomicrobiales bacterium]|nr:glycogen-binding domain-containing protein [Verrucomicrobiales bacterium]
MKKPKKRGIEKGIQQKFTLKALGARSVLLAADFTNWQQSPLPMKRLTEGVWDASVVLPPGVYHYRFVVDGRWRDDSEEGMHRTLKPWGSQNKLRVVPQVHQMPARAVNVPITLIRGQQSEWKHPPTVRAEMFASQISAL